MSLISEVVVAVTSVVVTYHLDQEEEVGVEDYLDV